MARRRRPRRRNPLHVGEDAVFALAFGAGGAFAAWYYLTVVSAPKQPTASLTANVVPQTPPATYAA